MRLFILLLMLSLSLSGYCAAAYAFGDIPVKDNTQIAMADMPNCPDMKADAPDNGKDYPPAKTLGMNCKACCISLAGAPVFVIVHAIKVEGLELSIFNAAPQSDISFPIFHPPKL